MNPYTDKPWLIMTAEQAAAIRGVVDGLGLDPMPLLDGRAAVPAQLLGDKRYEGRFGDLAETGEIRPLVAGQDFAEGGED